MPEPSNARVSRTWPLGGEAFRVTVATSAVDDLERRLLSRAVPPEPVEADWAYGAPGAYMTELLAHWCNAFDWSAFDAAVNRHEQFRVPVTVDGMTLRVHVVVEAGSNPELVPIVLTHGWPSLPFEFFGVVERIAHPERYGGRAQDGATVILPALPGFGYSERPRRPMHARQIAAFWRSLMVDHFDCPQFFAHGGDWGAVVSSWLGVDAPEALTGVHLSMLGLRPAMDAAQPLDKDELQWIKATQKRLALDGGYREQQATRPSTLAVGLADSPAFVAAWLVDKYHGWSGSAPGEPPLYSSDTLLTIASLYWFSGSLSTANWIYFADRNVREVLAPGQRCEVPSGFSFFGRGFFPAPPTGWINRGHNLRYRRDMDEGGHFPALLNPVNFADSLRACYLDPQFANRR